MATQRDKKNAAVDPKLRRKMLERWENEGGRVAEIDGRQTQPDRQGQTARRKTGK